ncbi:MAG: T9SS type A sorting domain-containing protein, partial [bacterium]
TKIQFSNMTFNSGQYAAETRDGKISVKGIVPVELSSFLASIMDGKVKLEWITTTESNNFGFYIQRTVDTKTDWQTIGFVQGKGTTTLPQTYAFTDSDVSPGIWYYRLKQQDLDGQINYSQIIEVDLLPTQFSLYQNYPNPFNSWTIIKYELPAGEHQVKFIIYDLLGHQIRTLVDEDNQPAGAYQINWDGRDDTGNAVASGVYFYRLQAGNRIFIKKMVLIE